MEKNDILKNVYEDFFGIESISKRNEELDKDIEKLNGNYKSLNNENVLSIEIDKDINKDEYMKDVFEKINDLYIEEKSKELLKKIVEYMRKYNEKIEKQYISFNLCLYSDNKETMSKIVEILEETGKIFSYIKDGSETYFSLYDIESEKIESIYNSKNNLVVIKGFEGFNIQDEKVKDKFINKLDEYLTKSEEQILTILNSKNKEIIKEAFKKNDEIIQKFFNFEIYGIKPDIQDAYQEVLSKIENNMEVSDEFKLQLLDYISTTYSNNNLPYPEYRDNLCDKLLFNKQIPEYEKEKSIEDIFADLNSLVGLEKVKNMLKDLVNLVELKNKAKDDLKIKNINLHMCFLGNPGTGKTTVARIVAEILYNLKYIKQNKLVEVSSKDLVAEYVGQTAPKTNSVIQKALRWSIVYR